MASQAVHTVISPSNETLNTGQRNVTTAGTAVALVASSTPCIEVLIQAKRTNTGRIYIGGSGVLNNDTNGVVLQPVADPGQPLSIQLSAQNLNQIYINSTVNGDGVTYIYW